MGRQRLKLFKIDSSCLLSCSIIVAGWWHFPVHHCRAQASLQVGVKCKFPFQRKKWPPSQWRVLQELLFPAPKGGVLPHFWPMVSRKRFQQEVPRVFRFLWHPQLTVYPKTVQGVTLQQQIVICLFLGVILALLWRCWHALSHHVYGH